MVTIVYFIAGISTVALLILLFSNAYQVLSQKREDVRNAENNVTLLQDCFKTMRNTPDEMSARKMLETSTQIYTQIEKRYNETFRKPRYRVLGLLMGFRKADRQKTDNNKKEDQKL
ncbi:MAG: hypothetical protein PHW03_02055 [Eubacteriales bacterium]|nr:hypothetical protein [Eubacteriales bacterium]